MKKLLISLLAIILTIPLLAGEKKNTFISEFLGISIEVPFDKETKAPVSQIVKLYLPASENFPANVNIQKQKYNKSLKTFYNLGEMQAKNNKWTIIQRSLKGNESLYECKGKMDGSIFHWYAKAVKKNGYIYLVTATCLDSQWEQLKTKLMESVNSFKIQKQLQTNACKDGRKKKNEINKN